MLNQPETHEAFCRGRRAVFHKLGLDMHAAVQAAEAGVAAPAAKPSLRSRIPSLLKGKLGLGIGTLVGGGVVASQLGKQPQVEVIPSAPVAPLFP